MQTRNGYCLTRVNRFSLIYHLGPTLETAAPPESGKSLKTTMLHVHLEPMGEGDF